MTDLTLNNKPNIQNSSYSKNSIMGIQIIFKRDEHAHSNKGLLQRNILCDKQCKNIIYFNMKRSE